MAFLTDPAAYSERLTAEIGVPVNVTLSRRASRIRIKMDTATGGAKVYVPSVAGPSTVVSFVRRHRDWIRTRAEAMPPRTGFGDGAGMSDAASIELFYRASAMLRNPRGKDPAISVDQFRIIHPSEIDVPGILRRAALARLGELTRVKASRIDEAVRTVSVEDVATRWGLCTEEGDISYSWRVMLAPEEITDYVVAHEVAHLAQMDHGPRFWDICGSLTATDTSEAREWLEANGDRLRRFGPPR